MRGGNTLEEWLNNLFLKVYPVGTIYTSVSNTNPSTYFGGIWEIYGSGKVLVGVDTSQTEFNSVEKTGGAKTHTLTTAEMPSHNHLVTSKTTTYAAGMQNTWRCLSFTGTNADFTQNVWSGNTGSTSAHNNLQPYITVYFWKRTA